MLTVDQILAAQRAQIETLFGLTNTAFSSVEKLVDLNITAAKAALGDAQEQAASVLGAKDAQELIALQAAALQGCCAHVLGNLSPAGPKHGGLQDRTGALAALLPLRGNGPRRDRKLWLIAAPMLAPACAAPWPGRYCFSGRSSPIDARIIHERFTQVPIRAARPV